MPTSQQLPGRIAALPVAEACALAAAALLVVHGSVAGTLQTLLTAMGADAQVETALLCQTLVLAGVVALALVGALRASGAWRLVGTGVAVAATLFALLSVLALLAAAVSQDV